jgi:hypothetical protein
LQGFHLEAFLNGEANMFLMRFVFGLGLLAAGVFLFAANPSLEQFETTLKARISSQKNMAETSVSFLRRITGVTSLKQATGLKSHEVCRRSVGLGSLFMLRKSSVTESEQPLALGVGAANRVYLADLQKESQITPLVKSIPFGECKKTLVN